MGLQGGYARARPQRSAENLAMFRFRGSSMLGRAPAQTSDDVCVEIPNEELGLLFHAINDSTVGGAGE